MTWNDLLRSACAGLVQHKLRTLLTLTGVTLGSLLLFTSLAGGLGVIDAVNRRLGIGDQLLEITASSGYITKDVTAEQAREAGITQDMSDERRVRLARASGVGGRQKVVLNLAAAKKLESLDHVTEVWPEIELRPTMYVENVDRWVYASVKAVHPSHRFTSLLIAGRDLQGDDYREVLVSELFLYRLGVQTDQELAAVIGSIVRFVPRNQSLEKLSRGLGLARQIGAPVDLTEMAAKLEDAAQKAPYESEAFTIVGVFRRPDLEEIRSQNSLGLAYRNVLMPDQPTLEIWKQLQNSDRPVQATVRVDKPEHIKSVESALSEMGYNTRSLSRLALQIRGGVLLITSVITALATAALLISGIGITNTMIMNVLERRKEIAILKSIGACDRDVNRMFLLEGMLIGVLGGSFGLISGWWLSRMTGDTIRQILERQLDEPFAEEIFAYPLWLIVLTPVIAALVTTLASILPARRAAKLDPVATLRAH